MYPRGMNGVTMAVIAHKRNFLSFQMLTLIPNYPKNYDV